MKKVQMRQQQKLRCLSGIKLEKQQILKSTNKKQRSYILIWKKNW